MVETIISTALHKYLIAQIQQGATRQFFRLDGFDDGTYSKLLDQLNDSRNKLATYPLIVRTTAPIQGYEKYALEEGKSATWYRNHVPPGHALVLIFNRRTSDAQSLKDIYPVTETSLVTVGLNYLMYAAFQSYQPSTVEVQVIKDFLLRLRRTLFEPQLRDIAEFLIALDGLLIKGRANTVQQAIAQALPYLGLFHCRDLADVINTPRGDRLLRDLNRAAQLGNEIIDDHQKTEFLARLKEAEFDDERAFGGSSPDEKRAALHQFLTDVITNRADLLRVLSLDWREVEPVLFKKARKTRDVQLKDIAESVEEVLSQETGLPDYVQDVLQDLQIGSKPDEEILDRLVSEYRELLGKGLSNKLRRLMGAKARSHSDLITGLTALAIELLNPLKPDIQAGTVLQVTFKAEQLGEIRQKEFEALSAFRVLYGGIETTLSSVNWDLAELWSAVGHFSDGRAELEDAHEREKVTKVDLPFRVTVLDANGQELAHADLIWQYRSDSPAAATLANLQAESNRLYQQIAFSGNIDQLPIPLYNTCPPADDIGDLDLRRPRHTLGAWYEKPGDLRLLMSEQVERRMHSMSWATVNQALIKLEQSWGRFIKSAVAQGVLAYDLNELLCSYHELLTVAAKSWRSGQEASYGYRVLTQAWVVGPETYDEWAVVPFLHPLKLSWWHERARRFNEFIIALLTPNTPSTVADEGRFRRELTATYGSAGFPAVLALPLRDGWPDLFLPLDETDGYELYRRSSVASEVYGLDPDLISDNDNKAEAQSAANTLANVIRDYIETYPFVRDGVEVFLLQCRNGALPGLLVEQLRRLTDRRKWQIRISVVVHTTDRGAPLFRRVSDWLRANETWSERSPKNYFPSVTLKVLECEYDDLSRLIEDTDIVILPDVLGERGQRIDSTLSDEESTDIPLLGYLPIYQAQQEPFEQGEYSRSVLLNPLPQPPLVRHFYNAQWAAKERRPISSDRTALFRKTFSLQDWQKELIQLHKLFNWVICYDTTVDRFLLEDTFPDTIQVIRYSLGLGTKGQHNLTVSSSNRAQDVVIRRLTTRLNDLLPGSPYDFRQEVAGRLVAEAKQISGDIVLRAAGPGAYLNELIGLVMAKHRTEKRYLSSQSNVLTTWIYLDDFGHWFEGKFPDMVFVAVLPESMGHLQLHIDIIETKCVGMNSFESETIDARRQTIQGVNRLARVWAPKAKHLDALYWYDQLYRAVVGNLSMEPDKRQIWELFRSHLHKGDFTLDLSGHSWVFCYDGSPGLASGQSYEEGSFKSSSPDTPDTPLSYHHYGRAGLREAMRELVEHTWNLQSPSDTWSTVYDTSPSPSLSEPAPELIRTYTEIPTHIDQLRSETIEITQSNVSAAIDDDWLQSRARDLDRVLRQYNIQVQSVDPALADIGPSIVRFKLRLRSGEQLNKLQRTANDLARELALTSIPLIENVLGTNYVGIDLPNPKPEMVHLLPLLGMLKQPSLGELLAIIGQTPDGKTIIEDISEFPHLLVAGATNSGKSVFLRSLVLCLLAQYPPSDLRLLVVDPKRTDFSFFNELPHLLGGKIVTEKEEARDRLLDLVHSEMPQRQHLMAGRSLRIKDFNLRYPDEALPTVVAIIDEYAQLISIMNKRDREAFERDLMSLAAVARATGIHLILATQRPSADVVTGTLKANLPASIAFKVASAVNSRIVIDQNGAENLLGRGDMLFRRPSGELLRLQAPYVDEINVQHYLKQYVAQN